MQTPSGARLHLCGDTRAVAAARFIKRPTLFRAFIKANPFLLIASWRGILATKNRALQRVGDTNMRMNAKELVADARATAPTLPPAAAKLMTAMADRLNVQFVALCESRSEAKQLAAENAALKAGIGFFSYDSSGCYEEHDTAEKAAAYAEDSIAEYRDNAPDGWSDEVGSVVWGVILQRATMTGLRPATEDDNLASHIEEWCDYTLLPDIKTPATDAFLSSLRAEGVEVLRQHPAIQLCSLTHVCDEVAAQLRSKSEVQP
ncbi:hypothetical protein IAE49_11565 [Kosakonia sp. S58]|uniref:hypothetical protein n=1 Tax=unclassified Kosakonia TaxID=2632876 RepID=UPI0019081A0B|nr:MULTISPECIES: hypothetical protein [unclassified Kosakonia]MBK0080098.1 hypothetical protein [Kosakonia sp. S57]MBK0086872.1 hypothetical protein [Kosakonia sp. S58]